MRISFLTLSVTLLIVLHSSIALAQQPIRLAIVLDDIGNSHRDLQALELPLAITFSILPYTPYAQKIAKFAKQQNRELLLHVPMQAKSNNHKLGKGALLLSMQENEFKTELNKAIQYLPVATGINNHMGSVLTEHAMQMHWIMDVLNKQGLYFLDSRTTAQTLAESTAEIADVPALRRHIFLDNIKTHKAMEAQFQQAIQIGKKESAAVIIAHPYPETLQFLSTRLNHNKTEFELVTLQQLLSPNERLKITTKRNEAQQVNHAFISDALPKKIQ